MIIQREKNRPEAVKRNSYKVEDGDGAKYDKEGEHGKASVESVSWDPDPSQDS